LLNSTRDRAHARARPTSKGRSELDDRLLHAGDPENPIQVLHRRAGIADLSPTELEAVLRLAAALSPPTIDNEFTAGER